MKVTVETKVDLPNEEVFKTILEDYYEDERIGKDGWCVFGSFEKFIQIKYQMAIAHKKERKKGWH